MVAAAEPKQMYQVLRPFVGSDGTEVPTGALVDAGDWPVQRIPQMIDQRYIRPVVIVPEEKAVPRGR